MCEAAGVVLYHEVVVGESFGRRKPQVFSVQVTHRVRCAVFALRGELDFDSMVQLQEAGDKELARGRGAGAVVADCSRLTFCDSSGIGVLVRLWQDLATQERALRLAAVPSTVVRLFSLTGLDQVFAVYADVEQALAVDTDHGAIVDADLNGPAQPKERQTA
ncbi:anti-sigma factor antagonist [Streptomyces sp. adm13(2018)]|nr:anti-sigma factor antagonist [Streptomyces sp. adm13(2018)]